MQGRIAAGEDVAAHGGVAAVPSGHLASGALDERNQGLDVVGIQPSLDGEVHMPHGEQGEVVAVAAVAGHANLVGQRAKGSGLRP